MTRLPGILALLATSLIVTSSFAQQTLFRAELNSDGVILGGVQGTISSATAVADFVLNQPPGGPVTVSYDIRVNGIDLDGLQTTGDPPTSFLDDMLGVHLHDITQCIPNSSCVPGDTASTVHLLNIAGSPRNGDDDDAIVDGPNNRITGLWDDGDANMLTPAPTFAPSDPYVLARLMNEEVALMIHTNEVSTAAIGGILRIVPEPAGTGWLLLAGLAAYRRRRTST